VLRGLAPMCSALPTTLLPHAGFVMDTWSTHRHDHINAKPHKLFGCVSQRARPISKVSIFNRDTLALTVAILAKRRPCSGPRFDRKQSQSK
jgi:hypothetical protein